MTAIVERNLGDRRVPQEVKDLRKQTWDFHITLGMPVIHKHRWNLRDVRDGEAVLCPLMHGEGSGRQWDPYCFGTGILGGFDDGVITYVTLGDAPIDTIRVSTEGVLTMDRHPQLTAPWIPDMGDGDIIITADFDADLNIIQERERYVLSEVTPVTMRGFQRQVQTVEFKVSQNAQVDLLPYGHEYYTVPIKFDYDSIPPDLFEPQDDLIPEEEVEFNIVYSSKSWVIKIAGSMGTKSFREQSIAIHGAGTTAEHSSVIRINGEDEGTTIILP